MATRQESTSKQMGTEKSSTVLESTINNTSRYQHWFLGRDDDNIAWLACDKKEASTNVLGAAVLEELDNILGELEQALPKALIIYSRKKKGFIAGADINEFLNLGGQKEATEIIQRGQRIFNRIETLKCPTIALIHGFCLGGGMELALACRYRIADDDAGTKLGLPEVKLGIHPGFGGTVRLPPLIGAPAAMDMMLSGRALSARAAKKIGVIDYAVPSRQLHFAAKEVALNPPKVNKACGWKAWTNNRLVRPLLATYLEKQVAKKASKEHYPAPYAMIDIWKNYFDDRQRMLAEEAASVSRLVLGSTAQSLIRVFFLQEAVKSLGGVENYAPQNVHVIGGGVMGGDIAAWCALRGLTVTIQDKNRESLARVMKRANGLFKKKLKQPRLVQAALDRLMPDIEGNGIAKADVVVEAIFENVEAKQTLFKELEPRMRKDALLATNTSSIPLQILSEALANPTRLVGLHFFNPVAQMQLIEIVSSEITDKNIAQRAATFARKIDRLPVPVTSTHGFLVNRVLMPYLMEAVILESEGVPANIIDKAALKFGMPMGPIHLADTVGLDICLSVAKNLSEQFGGDIPKRLTNLVDAGQLGVKTGKGFYEYKKGKPQKTATESTNAPADLTDRLLFRLLNECVSCLHEKVVADADLLDTGVIFGTGFAPFRGGPVNYIKNNGVAKMKAKQIALHEKYGDRFNISPGWDALDR